MSLEWIYNGCPSDIHQILSDEGTLAKFYLPFALSFRTLQAGEIHAITEVLIHDGIHIPLQFAFNLLTISRFAPPLFTHVSNVMVQSS
jgi:hypothetical protein